MEKYTAENTLLLAKRQGNKKRSFLLVNPIQAKHIPVSPKRALEMMRTLGLRLREKHPRVSIVIGFAETATAIGSCAAECFPECFYIHTTREDLNGGCVEFLEEHSHAAEQKIYTENLLRALENADEIIFVDDELSTGKTLLNIVVELREKIPCIQDKKIIAASIINRLSGENEKNLSEHGIITECLVKIEQEDYTERVAGFEISAAESLPENISAKYRTISAAKFLDPRTGVSMLEYEKNCRENADKAARELLPLIPKGGSVLVLGTEEFMYPSLILGDILESTGEFSEVLCHAATRSPIGVYDSSEYPIKTGYKIHSFYDDNRETFIYNLRHYDAAVVMSDTKSDSDKAIRDIAYLLQNHGCENIFYLR